MEFANLFKRCPGLTVGIDELAFILADIATRGRRLAWVILSTACRANERSKYKIIVSPIPGRIQKLFGLLGTKQSSAPQLANRFPDVLQLCSRAEGRVDDRKFSSSQRTDRE